MTSAPTYWNSPETTSINREPMLNLSHEESISLDGIWDFQLLRSPNETAGRNWSEIPVPGLWTMQPESKVFWDKPIYTNVQMPFGELPPFVPELNPTGIYRREFTVPSKWTGKRIVLQIGGFESVAILSINGREVGMAKDSRLAADFDITSFLKSGRNTAEIKVVKWSDATYIEDQDQWWHGGITRSIKLFATPEVHISRLYTTPGLAADLKTGTLDIRAYVAGANGKSFVGYTLQAAVVGVGKSTSVLSQALVANERPNHTEISPEHRRAGSAFFQGEFWNGKIPATDLKVLRELEPPAPGYVHFTATFPNIKPWSAESPSLYKLEIKLLDLDGKVIETFHQEIGFRDVRIKGHELLVNGKPVIIYGMNRHDFNRKTGRVLSVDDMRADLLELKKFNFNAVRTSHYPNDPALLNLCDELGFYVVGEANIESHAFQDSLCDDLRYLTPWVDRVARMIQRDIHHPSVILWSLGNESGHGHNHEAAAAFARSFDPSRPLHYEGAIRKGWLKGKSLTDVVCPMYPSINAIISYAKSKELDRPLIMCEYSHAMGNSNGNLAEYWDAIHSLPGLQGGFIWEFWDHGIEQQIGKGKTRSAYGGDFGETKHDGNFCCDGMVFPDRTPKPAMHEMKAIAAPLDITSKNAIGGRFSIFNKNFFVDTADYELRWKITANGELVDFGKVKAPTIKARATASVLISSKHLRTPTAMGERFITFTVVRKSPTPWASANTEIGWAQFPLTSKAIAKPKTINSSHLTAVVNDQGSLQLPFGQVAPALTLFRAPTDNDRIGHAATKWANWGLADLKREKIKITRTSRGTTIRSEWITGAGISVKHTQLVEQVVGGIRVTETAILPPVLDDVARVGTTLELAGTLDNFEYFGVGPHENYPDRRLGAVGTYLSSVAEQYTPYVRPQENGGHNGVRWFALFNSMGDRLKFIMDKPRQVSVTPHRAVDIAAATHDVDLKPSGHSVITIDAAHRGLGTASCGPDTLPGYIIKPGTYTWSWTLVTE